MYEFMTMVAGGRDHKEMGEAVSAALEQTCHDGWEPISFTPIGFRMVDAGESNMQSNNILDYRLLTTVQQIVFRRPV